MVRFRVEILDGCTGSDSALLRLTQAVAVNLEAFARFQALCAPTETTNSPDIEASILLCGQGVFEKWDVEADCVGCHAVTRGPFTTDDDDSVYLDRHAVAVNVDASMRCIRELLDDGEMPEDAVEAYAATIVHEAIHMALLVRFGAGRTPHVIFCDEGDWGIHQAQTLEGTEWDIAADEGDDDPDRRMELVEASVEEMARSWTPALLPGADIVGSMIAEFDQASPTVGA